MRKIFPAVVVVALALVAYLRWNAAPPPATQQGPAAAVERGGSSAEAAFRNHSNGVEVQGTGTVTAILPDDVEGGRHQRFLVRVDPGPTILIAHNIDLAPRLASLRIGDAIEFRGEYVWNPKGGLVHWTHRDPNGHHQAGWLKHNGDLSQ